MNHHEFIFKPGIWLGEGKIKLSVSEENLKFSTRWKVDAFKESGPISSVQEIQIYGIEEIMKNQFMISLVNEDSFKIQLENEAMGKVYGEGMIKPKLIGWEFRSESKDFEGFEIYELLADGSYFMHAEYASTDDLRTQIQGKIWRKTT